MADCTDFRVILILPKKNENKTLFGNNYFYSYGIATPITAKQ